MSSTSIIQSCPCCDAALVLDLATGDLEALNPDEAPTLQVSEASSGIQVKHVTPEYHHKYIDPTHYRGGYPILTPLSGSEPKFNESEYYYVEPEPADEATIDKRTIAHQEDLKKRGLIR